ncbi:MAG: phosphoribosylformylglycinamidine synthase subunit PurQ, partial [Gammaproteobacteria bacterium]|nr:phosphoribosylformylglycinamidine synthase subunit PurQ [Gammaproteobacteria bacterium]
QLASTPAQHLSDSAVRYLDGAEFGDIFRDVLLLPAVGSKRFLITIGDRSVGGLTARDQMVGPFQEPVADVAVSRFAMQSEQGIAMAIGERAALAVHSPVAACRMAFTEALTNLMAADISDLNRIRLSANWMMSSAAQNDKADLFEAVKSVCNDMSIPLSVSVPVGKDSVTMRTVWPDGDGAEVEVKSPLTLVITAFAHVDDVRRTLTPFLPSDNLVLVHLPVMPGVARLGGSALTYVRPHLAQERLASPDADAESLKRWFAAVRAVRAKAVAWHDVSDGGLITAVAEMAMCSRAGLCLDIGATADPLATLYSEEAGAVMAVPADDLPFVTDTLRQCGQACIEVARTDGSAQLSVKAAGLHWRADLSQVWQWWHETSYQMQSMRDDPACARSERDEAIASFEHRRGLFVKRTFSVTQAVSTVSTMHRPTVAILREQGCNGHAEMAWAFDRAGFDAVDVCMQDLIDGRVDLNDFRVMAACGGFSHADVLGAGWGWALSVLNCAKLQADFTRFFQRPDTLTLGVCNGCQFLSHLRKLIPGAQHWPTFQANASRQYESRLVMATVCKSNSAWLESMQGASLPVIVAHGEGRAAGVPPTDQICLRYTDPFGHPTTTYPHNPNGSTASIAGVCSADGRVLITMPHPERLTETGQYSWLPPAERDIPSPWLQLFYNAQKFIARQGG